MDDLAGAIFGLIIACVIIVALIYLLVYVIIPGAICVFLGRAFYRQLKQYQLSNKAKWVLVGVGAVSIAVSATAVISLGYPHWVIIPASALGFLLLSIPTLAGWAYSKKKIFLDIIHQLEGKRSQLNFERDRTRQDLEYFSRNISRLNQDHQHYLEESGRIEGHLRDLCNFDARTYSIKRREWEGELASLNPDALETMKKRLIKEVKQVGSENLSEKINLSIPIALINLQLLEKKSGNPRRELLKNEARVRDLTGKQDNLNQAIEEIDRELSRNQSAYKGFSQSRIVLD